MGRYRRVGARMLVGLGVDGILRAVKGWRGEATILCFHRISDEVDESWPSMPVATFERLASYLHAYFDVITLDELRAGTVHRTRPAAILTFDDGYSDFYENALPILSKLGLPSVHNVVVESVETKRPPWTQRVNNVISSLFRRSRPIPPLFEGAPVATASPFSTSARICEALFKLGSVDRELVVSEMERRHVVSSAALPRMMGWEHLRKCIQERVEIGSHTVTHAALTSLSDDELRAELEGSRASLRRQLGIAAETISFPNGIYDGRVVDFSRNAGYRNLLTTDDRGVRRQERQSAVLPRVLVGHETHAENALNVGGLFGMFRRVRRRRGASPSGPR